MSKSYVRLDLKKHRFTVTRDPRRSLGRKAEEEIIGHFSNVECALLTAADRGRYGFKINGMPIEPRELDEAVQRFIAASALIQ